MMNIAPECQHLRVLAASGSRYSRITQEEVICIPELSLRHTSSLRTLNSIYTLTRAPHSTWMVFRNFFDLLFEIQIVARKSDLSN